jgi:hypothetical protein
MLVVTVITDNSEIYLACTYKRGCLILNWCELATCRLPATCESYKQTDASCSLTAPKHKADALSIFFDQQQAVTLKEHYRGLIVFLYCSADSTLKFGNAFFIHPV